MIIAREPRLFENLSLSIAQSNTYVFSWKSTLGNQRIPASRHIRSDYSWSQFCKFLGRTTTKTTKAKMKTRRAVEEERDAVVRLIASESTVQQNHWSWSLDITIGDRGEAVSRAYALTRLYSTLFHPLRYFHRHNSHNPHCFFLRLTYPGRSSATDDLGDPVRRRVLPVSIRKLVTRCNRASRSSSGTEVDEPLRSHTFERTMKRSPAETFRFAKTTFLKTTRPANYNVDFNGLFYFFSFFFFRFFPLFFSTRVQVRHTEVIISLAGVSHPWTCESRPFSLSLFLSFSRSLPGPLCVSSFSLSFSSVPSKSPRHRTEQKWTTRAPPVHGTLNTLAAAPPPPPPPPPQHATATTAVRRAAPYLKLAPRRARRLARERSRCVPAGYTGASSPLLSSIVLASLSLFTLFSISLSLSLSFSFIVANVSLPLSLSPRVYRFRFSHLVRLFLSTNSPSLSLSLRFALR